MANGLFNLKQVMQAVQQGGWPAQRTPFVEYLVVAGGGGVGGCDGAGRLANRQTELPHRLGRGPHAYFDVVAQTVEAIHQLALREIGKVAARQPRDLRLRNAHAPAGLFLR